jgi:branched-chain amino acid transport system substrate-binding protein
MHKVVDAFNAKHPGETYYARMFNMTGMLFKAIDDTKSNDPVKIAADLEGMTYPTFTTGKDGFMRKDDHQFFQPLFVSDFGPLSADQKYDEEKTGWGWKPGVPLSTQETVVPTSCKMERP